MNSHLSFSCVTHHYLQCYFSKQKQKKEEREAVSCKNSWYSSGKNQTIFGLLLFQKKRDTLVWCPWVLPRGVESHKSIVIGSQCFLWQVTQALEQVIALWSCKERNQLSWTKVCDVYLYRGHLRLMKLKLGEAQKHLLILLHCFLVIMKLS